MRSPSVSAPLIISSSDFTARSTSSAFRWRLATREDLDEFGFGHVGGRFLRRSGRVELASPRPEDPGRGTLAADCSCFTRTFTRPCSAARAAARPAWWCRSRRPTPDWLSSASDSAHVGLVLGRDRQLHDAALAVHADELGFDRRRRPSGAALASSTRSLAMSRARDVALDRLRRGRSMAPLASTSFTMPLTMAPFGLAAMNWPNGSCSSCLTPRRDALALRVDRQHDGFQRVALLVVADHVFAGGVPADVGQVDQAVDAAVQADEDAEVGDRLDLARRPCRPSCGWRRRLPTGWRRTASCPARCGDAPRRRPAPSLRRRRRPARPWTG